MKILRRYWKETLVFLLISVLYFSVRIPNLTLQPIFADEAIYVRWAQVMKAEPTLRFLPVSDGKTPLYMWALIPLFKVFEDPLYAGRILSVIAGFGTMLGVFLIGWRFFSLRVGLWAAFLMTFTPYIVFFDRMALVDSMASFFSVWSLFIGLLLIQLPRIDLAMALGYLLGGGLLTKPPGFFSVLSLPATLIAFNWTQKNRQKNFLKLFLLWILAIFITLVIYNILRLGPGFGNLNQRNQDYVFSPTDLIGRPLDPFIPHVSDLIDWFPKLLTPPILLVIFIGITFILFDIYQSVIKNKILLNRYLLVILFWSLIPLIIQMALLKTFTARYILFSIPPLLIISAVAINRILDQMNKFIKIQSENKGLIFKTIIIIILLPFSLIFIFNLLIDPSRVNLPKNERRGYLQDWTAGYGLKEVAHFLDERSKEGLVVVGTEGSFGTLPDGLQIYLDKNRQVVVIGGKSAVSSQLRDSAKEHETYFVTNRNRYKFVEERLEKIMEYPKAIEVGREQDAILVFRVYALDEATSSAALEN